MPTCAPSQAEDVIRVAFNGAQRADPVREFDRSLRRAYERPGIVDLDLTGVGTSHTRLTPQWGAVVANVLAAAAKEPNEVRVEIPRDHSGQQSLARAGIYFALARNRHLDWESAAQSGLDVVLRPWRKNWRPANIRQPLFAIETDRDDQAPPESFYQDRFVAFLNPDQVRRNIFPGERDAAVYPWLRTLFGNKSHLSVERREAVLRDVSVVTSELLENIRDHAGITNRDLCSISLFTTGSGRDTRLYISVLDTGIGMDKSIRSKGEYPPDSNDHLHLALEGKLPPGPRDRGQGLRRIMQTVISSSGSLFLATSHHETGTLTLNAGGSSRAVSAGILEGSKIDHYEDLSMQGTVLVVSIPLSG